MIYVNKVIAKLSGEKVKLTLYFTEMKKLLFLVNVVQAVITNSSETFLKDAVVERYNLSKLNKTRIRFKIQLKKTTKSNAPKWTDVLKYSQDEQESDLVKVTTSEVGLKGIKVFKALDEAANQLRQEIASVQEWMNYDNGDWICSIDLAPLVWNKLI